MRIGAERRARGVRSADDPQPQFSVIFTNDHVLLTHTLISRPSLSPLPRIRFPSAGFCGHFHDFFIRWTLIGPKDKIYYNFHNFNLILIHFISIDRFFNALKLFF